jgi:hypothetical protein
MRVGPGQEAVEVAVSAVLLADLTDDDRHPRGHPADVRFERRDAVLVIDVNGRDRLMDRVGGLPGQPARPRSSRRVDPAEQHRLRGTGRPDRVEQLLHAGGRESKARAAVAPASPADTARLVEEVEEDRVVVAEI